jgi:hypothetical protein
MKTTLRLITFVAIFLFGSRAALAQSDPLDSVKIKIDSVKILQDSLHLNRHHPKTSHIEAAFNYQSNDVYLGRKDSSVLPYYIPAFSYYHKSGLYVTASLNYLKNSNESRVDLVTLEAGYMFSKGKYYGQFSASKYFYNSQSTSVTSEISAAFAYQNSYDFGFVSCTFTGTLNIGNKADFEGLFGLEHTFYFFDDNLDVTPTLAMAASTQNYYNSYYKQRRYTIKRKGQKPQQGVAQVTGTVLNASEFKLLDYEPALPINYSVGKCTFNFTPTYSIPVNPATIDVHTIRDNGQVIDKTKPETISNTFYWTLGLSFLF